jgi:DNA polymerase-3 subunit epsilon
MKAVVFDVETSGLSPQQGHRIIELGAVKVEQGRIVDEFCTLVNGAAAIDPRAQAVHGISSAMLRGQPQPEDVIPRFRDFIGRYPLVAHNAVFDARFLRAEFALQGFALPNAVECTLLLSRRKLRLPNHRLETVYQYFFGELPPDAQPHRALDDARLAARIWLKLKKV